MIPYVVVPGTHARHDRWHQPGSPWSDVMRAMGFAPAASPAFVWSTDVNGWQFWRRWVGSTSDHSDWDAAGANLYQYIVPPLAPDRRLPPARTHLIAHSHALQVVLYACAKYGLEVNTLTTIGSPIRKDVPGRTGIRFWQHVHSDGTDRMQWFGTVGDGSLGIVRPHPDADLNIEVKEAGHSGVLRDPYYIEAVWPGLCDAIRRAHVEAER